LLFLSIEHVVAQLPPTHDSARKNCRTSHYLNKGGSCVILKSETIVLRRSARGTRQMQLIELVASQRRVEKRRQKYCSSQQGGKEDCQPQP
jgi:hypothetical protein